MKDQHGLKLIKYFFEHGLNIHGSDLPVLVPKPEYLDKEDYKFKEFYFGGFSLKIKDGIFNKFMKKLDEFTIDNINKLAKMTLSIQNKDITLTPKVEIKIEGEFKLNEPDTIIGENFTYIDKKFDKLFTLVKNEFGFISKTLNEGSVKYSEDKTKFKDKDLFMLINTLKPGKEVNLFISLTEIPPVFDATVPLEPNREPMTSIQYDDLLGYPSKNKDRADTGIKLSDDIKASLDRINDAIVEFLESDKTNLSDMIKEYALNKIDGILIPSIVTVQLRPYSQFGNGYNIKDLEEGTADVKVLTDPIDEEVTKVIEHLKNIPIPEGKDIAYYSLDTDSLGIYGRSEDGKVTQAMVESKYMFNNVFMPSYSEGFGKMFTEYLKTIKNKHFFTQMNIDPNTLKEYSEDDIQPSKEDVIIH